MRLLDLFAGIGGFSLAAHWMGWETVAFVERDKFCQRVLRKNFGQDIEIHDDITTFSGEPFRGRVDVITGGFPCQPFSAAGRRQGVNDERHLFPEALRIVREVQPTWFVLENVAGLLSMANESWDVKVAGQPYSKTPELHDYQAILSRTEIMLLHCICEEIEREGYAVQPVVVPASAVGAWHERKRVWIVANTGREYGAGQPITGQSQTAGGQESGNEPQQSDSRYTFRTTAQSSGIRRDDRGDIRQERHVQTDGGIATKSKSERHGRIGGTGTIGSDAANANGKGLPSYSAIERLPDWAGGTVGMPGAVTEFERPGGREIERDFRGVPNGVSARVDRLRTLGNSIVPQIALEIFKAIEASR
jgi:DNA (cytosine-5)-methyltransferase 1